MKALPLHIANLPCPDPTAMAELLKIILPGRVSHNLRDTIEYALLSSEHQGLADETGETAAAFLDDEVRYHLTCDHEQAIISLIEYKRQSSELNRLIQKTRKLVLKHCYQKGGKRT